MPGYTRRGPQGARKQMSTRGLDIGNRIAEARREAGLTQDEVAKQLGVSERAVQDHEAGKVIPYRYVRDLERILGRSAHWLLHGKEASSVDASEILTEVRALRTEVRDLAQAVHTLTDQVGTPQ